MHTNSDTPNIPRTTLDDAELLLALTSVWETANKREDALTCKLLQDQMERLLTGKRLMIRIDSGLNLRVADLM